eukprot:COSAG02_NODE_12365_length_1557_cov_3.104938_2_plen_84_part_00
MTGVTTTFHPVILGLSWLKVKNDDPDWTGLPEPPPCWEAVERALDIEIVHSTSVTVIGKEIQGLQNLHARCCSRASKEAKAYA